VRILRQEIELIGYKKTFNIFDDQDQGALMKKVVKKLEINTDQFNPNIFRHAISKAKNQLLDPEEFRAGIGGYFEEVTANVYDEYQRQLKENNALDFDDLIRITVKIFQKFPEVLEKYQKRFKYILVDEYQDTNRAQYVLVNLLAEKHRNICVVGDDWQSIYGWRQADIQNILDFEKDYPEAKVVTLEQNYRSSQTILDAAYGVISKNVVRKDKKLWTEKKEGSLISSYEAEDERDEAEFIAREIKKIMSESGKGSLDQARDGKCYTFSSFVVLYRTNAQSRMVEEMMLRHSIPYRIVGGIKFYQRKEVKDVVAHIRLINDFNDRVSLERIINEPKRNIGPRTLEKWFKIAEEKSLNPIEAGLLIVREKDQLPAQKIEAITKFSYFVKRMSEVKNKLKLTDLVEKVYRESGYEKFINDGTVEGEGRHENVMELVSVAQKYDELLKDDTTFELDAFLEEVALASDTDSIDQGKEAVHLMTMHSAKGLEFPVVFIIGLEEGIIPHSRSMLAQNEMEEERRLMYVGITRAKEKVFLLFTTQRTIFGSLQMNAPSRFLDEIPSHLMQDAEVSTPKSKVSSFISSLNSDVKITKPVTDFKDGEKVRHQEFGEGIVISTQNGVVTVVFKKVGLKKLAAEFAKLEKI
jgi:DNA helicase-2/ATP-dependent DNA helicase PcrA